MLTIHDCTFNMRWKNWGPRTMHVERVAQATMLRLLNMKQDEVLRLARSKKALTTMSVGARMSVLKVLLAHKLSVPQNGDIVLEVIACPKG